MYHTELLTVLARKWEFLPGKRIISIGRYNEQKGYDRLIEAWGKVNRKHPDWHIRITERVKTGTGYKNLSESII